jgi:hypothetical protein
LVLFVVRKINKLRVINQSFGFESHPRLHLTFTSRKKKLIKELVRRRGAKTSIPIYSLLIGRSYAGTCPPILELGPIPDEGAGASHVAFGSAEKMAAPINFFLLGVRFFFTNIVSIV